jgi:hypothetical protein
LTGGHTSSGGAAAAGDGGGGVAHPAATSAMHAAHDRGIEDNAHAPFGARERWVGWVFLEIAIALAIAVAIVWWTMPRKTRKPEDEDGR